MSEEEQNDAWNKYIDKYGFEPSDASKLLNFSKNKHNQCANLSFSNARKIINRNKGKGTISKKAITSTVNIKSDDDEKKYEEISEIDRLREQLENMRQQRDSLQTKNDYLQYNYDILLKQKDFSSQKKEHSDEFWVEIEKKVKTDRNYIKSLIKENILSVFDTNKQNQTLLHIATKEGCYEIVELCINLGADINYIDNTKRKPIDWAVWGAWTHIEQLLRFSEMGANIGNRIKETSYNISKHNGIIENIMNQLNLYKNANKKLVKDTLIDIMINIISQKKAFSDDLLNLCWQFISDDNNNALTSNLWKTLKKTCIDIVKNGNKRDWFWFKTFIIPSTIWYKQVIPIKNINNVSEEKQNKSEIIQEYKYLYYELLELVDDEGANQLNELDKNLQILANKNTSDWNKLIKFNINTEYMTAETARQDLIPNGISSQYTFHALSKYAGCSGLNINIHKFYDYNEYLSQLLLLAHIADDGFQKSVINIFGIERDTNSAKLQLMNSSGTGSGDGMIKYERGPIKLMDRARTKAENDYSKERYPTTACILDLNRCSLIFNDISTLLGGLELFCNKIKYYQSGDILGIVRCKNGFIEYIENGVQYADCKLNVIIKTNKNNLIGEIQFLLKTMKEFKNKAHRLYGIQRQREYIENCVSSILPMLQDMDKELFVAGNMGDVHRLCNLMTINNKTEKDIMKVDKESNESILVSICTLGMIKPFLFLKSSVRMELFIDRLFLLSKFNENAIELALEHNQMMLIQIIFGINQVKQKYLNNDQLFYRLIFWLFGRNGNVNTINYILSTVNILNTKIMDFVGFRYKQSVTLHEDAYQLNNNRLIAEISRSGYIDSLKKLHSIIGDKLFIQYALEYDGWNETAIETAIQSNNLEILKYFLNKFQYIKNRYLNEEYWFYRLLYWLFAICNNVNTINIVLSDEFGLNIKRETIIKFIMEYEYEQQMDEFYATSDDPYELNEVTIFGEIVTQNCDIDILIKLYHIIDDDKVFIENILRSNYANNMNALEIMINKNKLDMIQYVMVNVKGLIEYILNDNDALFRILWWILKKCENKEIFQFIVGTLKLTEKQLTAIQNHKCKPLEKEDDDDDDDEDEEEEETWDYSKEIITDDQVMQLLTIHIVQ